jgi:hypothetical protein
MDVTVQPSVPPGLYDLTILGSAPGLPDRTATFPLTVIPRGDFGLNIAPNAFDTNRGATLTAMVTVGRFNWPADIGLSIYWNTAGISSALSTSVLKGGALTSTLTINVGPDAPLGRGAVGVRATSGCFEYDFVVDVIVLSEG